MKYAFFMMPLHTPNENPSLAFERDIDMINYAEKLGFDEYFIGEHHSAAWETMPTPELVLAKASATATRITLGDGRCIAAVSSPVPHRRAVRFPGPSDARSHGAGSRAQRIADRPSAVQDPAQ